MWIPVFFIVVKTELKEEDCVELPAEKLINECCHFMREWYMRWVSVIYAATCDCALIPLVTDITELWSWVYWNNICYSFGAEYILKVVILFAGFTICIAAFWKTLYWISSPWNCCELKLRYYYCISLKPEVALYTLAETVDLQGYCFSLCHIKFIIVNYTNSCKDALFGI